jgi:hypothetical protein
MRTPTLFTTRFAMLAAVLALAACSSGQSAGLETAAPAARTDSFEQDRQAILAMAGSFHVRFHFIETVAYTEGYEPKPVSETGGNEVVRVIEDRGDFISLQHLLVAHMKDGSDFVVKHWRQDWQYEPERVFAYVGGNAWEMRDTRPAEVAGKWSQSVYQVDDSPRYAAIAAWTHTDGLSEWTAPRAWRPLPRRDATTRDDYDVVDAVNRHAITPTGSVHEQDNEKLVLQGDRHVLVREIAYNTYDRADDFNVKAADDYWAKTSDFWSQVRDEWASFEAVDGTFGLTMQGEAEQLYTPVLEAADAVNTGDKSSPAAAKEAIAAIRAFTTTDVGTLASRVAKRPTLDEMKKQRETASEAAE